MSDVAFGEYVAGRTIAIIGPGQFRRGDSELIRSHDLVYVMTNTPYSGHVHIRFLNTEWTRLYRRNVPQLPSYEWLVSKTQVRDLPNARTGRFPKGINPNMVTMAIYDLEQFAPADVNVYGADLYLAGPDGAYRQGYDNRPAYKQFNGIMSHRPQQQHALAREIMLRTGWFSRSTAYREALELDTDEYYAQLKASWSGSAGLAPAGRAGWAA